MPPLERRPLAAAMALLFSSISPVAAQSVPDATAQQANEPSLPEVKVKAAPEEPGFRTDVIRTGTRTETPLRDIPQIINVVPQSLIRSQNATTLQDALRNVPGISYAAAEGGTQANQVFYLRGFPLNQDIFIDAVRDLGEYNRDLFATEAVEVLKGSSAVMFGRGSTGGVINQVSKLANPQERGEVALTVGSFSQKRATADVNLRTTDSSAVRLIGLYEDSDSYRYPRGVEKRGFAPSFWMNVGNVDRDHVFLLLPEAEGRDRLRSADVVHQRARLPRLSAGVARKLLRLRQLRLCRLRNPHRNIHRRSPLQRHADAAQYPSIGKLQARIRIDDLDVVGHRCRRCASDPRHAAVAVVGHPQP